MTNRFFSHAREVRSMATGGSRALASPKVSVIIPVYNHAGELQRCLEALARQTLPRAEMEVLVVDNGSTEDLAGVRDGHAWVTWLHEPLPGSYAARNRALAEARGDVLAFTDADCLPQDDWLERGLGHLALEPAVGMLAGRVELFPADPRKPTGSELWDMEFGLRNEDYLRKDQFGVTANLFVRRAVFARVGPFDDRLKSSGDLEWGKRAHAAGVVQRFAGDVVVRHPARPGLRELASKARRIRGGYHDRGLLPRGGRLARRWLSLALPPRGRGPALRRISSRHGRRAAARFYATCMVRNWVVLLEEIRLRLGGTSRR